MRIARLHLQAYGHFSDCVLQFGAAPGLHFIYGDNETGKTTTLRALSSVLFGYPHHAVDAFKHGPRDIAIGVDLVAKDGRSLSFVRRRTGRGALADGAGRPLDETTVASFLGGVSQEIFENVFALNHERLRAHAQALLADGGALGFTLAEAGAGVAGIKAMLDHLVGQRTELFLSGGSKPKLNQLIRRLGEIKKEARSRTISPEAYRKLQKQIEEVTSEIDSVRTRQKRLATDIERLGRIGRNLPRRAQHAALTQRLSELESVPLLPSEATQQRVRAQTERETAQQALSMATAAIDQLDAKIAATVPDQRVLARRVEIKRLAERRGSILKAMEDLPRREVELDERRGLVADYLKQAELAGTPDDLDRILPSAIKRIAIDALAKQGASLAAKRATTADQLDRAEHDLESARERSRKISRPPDVSNVVQALAEADRLGDVTGDFGRRTLALERKSAALRESIIGLGLASGEVSALRSIAVPPEKTVNRYAHMLGDKDTEIESARRESSRLAAESDFCAEKILTLRKLGRIASEDDLRVARQVRQEGWSLVRGIYVDRLSGLEDRARAFAPDGQVVEAYEQRVAEADRVADAIRSHIEEATQLSLLTEQRAMLEEKKATVTTRHAELEARRAVIVTEWEGLWPREAVTPRPPDEMTEWLASRINFLAQADELAAEADELRRIEQKVRTTSESLAAALQASGVSAQAEDGFDTLRERARRLREQITAANTQYEKVIEAERVQERSRTLAAEGVARLDAEHATWRASWEAALVAAGLSATLTIEAALAVLNTMKALDVEKRSIDELNHRIETMHGDHTGFSMAVGEVVYLLPEAGADSIETCRRLDAALEDAIAAETELKGLKEQLKTRMEERDKAQGSLDRSEAVLKSLCDLAGCSDPQELAAIERKSDEKQTTQLKLTELETEVRTDGAGLGLEVLFAECEGNDGSKIAGEIDDLTTQREELVRKIDTLNQRKGGLEEELKALTSQDQAADSFQEVANLEAEAAEIVEAYVDLALQETLLRKAIDLYRDRNQGPILGRAKALFAELTNGAYTGLRADLDDRNQPILIAEDRVRGSLEVPALSDGTVDPLYLALRLAVIQEHNAMREPLPFIADDLLLNFGNARAQAAFRTLAQIATLDQVLFFTHHLHLLELARSAVPQELLIEHHLPRVIQADQTAE